MGIFDNDEKNFFFEYIYYRVTKVFYKRDGSSGYVGIGFITLIQGMSIAIVLNFLIEQLFNQEFRALHASQFGYIMWGIGLLLFIYNGKLYGGKYYQYHHYWKDELAEERTQKGYYVILTFFVPVIITIVF